MSYSLPGLEVAQIYLTLEGIKVINSSGDAYLLKMGDELGMPIIVESTDLYVITIKVGYRSKVQEK